MFIKILLRNALGCALVLTALNNCQAMEEKHESVKYNNNQLPEWNVNIANYYISKLKECETRLKNFQNKNPSDTNLDKALINLRNVIDMLNVKLVYYSKEFEDRSKEVTNKFYLYVTLSLQKARLQLSPDEETLKKYAKEIMILNEAEKICDELYSKMFGYFLDLEMKEEINK